MPSGQYSYLDIAALDAVRQRFAAGDAMAILTPSLDEVIWANGPGAELFGFSDIESIIGAEPQMGFAAKRQIMATSGYPAIGKDRAITVRLASGMTSRAVAFVASEIALPDGEDAILLAVPAPAATWRSPADAAARAIAGLDQAGQYTAIVGAEGVIVAASPGFETLGIAGDTLAALVAEARNERLVKRMIAAAAAKLPAGFVRLTDHPAMHLLAVIDEVLPEQMLDEHVQDGHVQEMPQSEPAEQEPAAVAANAQAPTAGELQPEPATPAEIHAEPVATPDEPAAEMDAKVVDAADAGVSGEPGEAEIAALDEPAIEEPAALASHDDPDLAEKAAATGEARQADVETAADTEIVAEATARQMPPQATVRQRGRNAVCRFG